MIFKPLIDLQVALVPSQLDLTRLSSTEVTPSFYLKSHCFLDSLSASAEGQCLSSVGHIAPTSPGVLALAVSCFLLL